VTLLGACGPAQPAQQPAPQQGQPTQQPQVQAPAAGGQKVSLRWFFWTGSEGERQFWEGLAADAMKQFPNIEVKFETDAFNNYWPKLQTAQAGGQVADILGLQSYRTATFASRGIYLPLDDFIKAEPDVKLDDFFKPIVDGLSFKGKLYALAYDFGPLLIFFNKTLFQKAGVALPKEDWTSDDFVSSAKALSREIDGKQVFGFIAPNAFDPLVPWIWSNGGDYSDDGMTKSLLSKPETVDAIQRYTGFVLKDKVAPPISDPGNPQWASEQFFSSRVAMSTDGPWQFVNIRSRMKDDWDVALFPKGKAGSIPQVAGSGFGISANTKFKNEAWQVVKFITSTDSLSKVAKAGRGYPGRASAVPAFIRKDVPPEHQELVEKQAKMGRPIRTNPVWEEINTLLAQQLLDPILVNNQPVSDTIASVDPKYQALLDKGAKQG
jgi:ABC-type glycerol-3-phosphate transport system substrate-binding protein